MIKIVKINGTCIKITENLFENIHEFLPKSRKTFALSSLNIHYS